MDSFHIWYKWSLSMRRCVACDDLWPWPISSRSFDLDSENRVRSVTFSALNRLFPYLPQIITTIKRVCRMLFWLGIWYESLVWVIMGQRWVFSERRHSSCCSLKLKISYVHNVCSRVMNGFSAHKRVILVFISRATREINNKITLEWAQKLFVTKVHTLFYFLHDLTNR